jgi:membrane peptidoglycan carboxypeptidase
VEPRSILSVTDRHGKDITKTTQPSPKAVLDPRIAYMITSILSDDSSRQPEFPANGPLTLGGRPVAAKTGTTNDFRDNWTVGYTPQMVTAVWVGNNDHTPMQNVDGITGAAPIWHDYMSSALNSQPQIAFSVPGGVTTAKVCADGGLAAPGTPGTSEVFLSDSLPTKQCSLPIITPSPQPSPDATGDDPGKHHGRFWTDPNQGSPPPDSGPDNSGAFPTPPEETPPNGFQNPFQ